MIIAIAFGVAYLAAVALEAGDPAPVIGVVLMLVIVLVLLVFRLVDCRDEE